jgi:hypothetical protein
MTPVRWPGTTRKGVAAVFCWRSAPRVEEVVWLRSYWRRMSYEALEGGVSYGVDTLIGGFGTYHISVRPLGMARTELTGPLTLGNLKVREGSERVLCRLYSSTVPLRLEAVSHRLCSGSWGSTYRPA